MNNFFEETAFIIDEDKAKKKYNVLKIISIGLFACAIIWFIVVLCGLPYDGLAFYLIGLIPQLFFLISAIFLWFFKDSYYIDYDYRFSSGEVIIMKVIDQKKRRKGISFRCNDLERFGDYGSETYLRYKKMPNVKVLYMTSNETPAKGKNFYYAVYNTSDKKLIIVLECSKEFVKCVTSHCRSYIFDLDV